MIDQTLTIYYLKILFIFTIFFVGTLLFLFFIKIKTKRNTPHFSSQAGAWELNKKNILSIAIFFVLIGGAIFIYTLSKEVKRYSKVYTFDRMMQPNDFSYDDTIDIFLEKDKLKVNSKKEYKCGTKILFRLDFDSIPPDIAVKKKNGEIIFQTHIVPYWRAMDTIWKFTKNGSYDIYLAGYNGVKLNDAKVLNAFRIVGCRND